MNRKRYGWLILLVLALIVSVGVWLAPKEKPKLVRAVVAAAHESPAVAEKRKAARAAVPVSAEPSGSLAMAATPAPIPPPLEIPPVRRSDLELQSQQFHPVKLMPPRVAADAPLLPGFAGPATWRNLGTATASAAFETHCWAIDHGDVDVLLSTVDLSDAARAKLKTIFDRLPAEDRAKYGSPERMIALVWVYHGLPFSGFMIESEAPHSPSETGVLLQLQYGQQSAAREFVFQRANDGWRKVTPDQQVDNFLRMSGISPDTR